MIIKLGNVIITRVAKSPFKTKSANGYFITVKDVDFPTVEHTWAVTKSEIKDLKYAIEALEKEEKDERLDARIKQ